MDKFKKLEKRMSELETTIELQAETITGYQANIQNDITELTRHFMASIEPALRSFVREEIKSYLKLNGIVE